MAKESEGASSFRFVVDKVSFVNKLSILNKATSDDARPTPGYMYQEICNISYECGSFCTDLLEYFISRLEKRSYHVKLKVLRLMRYVVENGHREFRQGLRRKAHGVREAMKFGGPPDPLHGNAPYIMVRKEAKELCTLLFEVQEREESPQGSSEPLPNTSSSAMGGMGTGGSGKSVMQGFGNAPPKEKTLTESIVGGLRDIAGKVMEPVPRSTSLTATNNADKHFSSYEPIQFGSSDGPSEKLVDTQTRSNEFRSSNQTARAISKPFIHKKGRAHRPGVAGGGWEDSDEESNLQGPGTFSAEGTGHMSAGSLSNSRPSSGNSSDQHCSRNRSSVPRQDDLTAENYLVKETIEHEDILLKRSDIENFIKKCQSLNCSKIAELVGSSSLTSSPVIQLHCLQLIEAFLRTDLLSPDDIANKCESGLEKTFRSKDSQVSIKARKVILILERLCSEGSSVSDIIQDHVLVSTSDSPGAAHEASLNVDKIESEPFTSSFPFIKEPFSSSSGIIPDNS